MFKRQIVSALMLAAITLLCVMGPCQAKGQTSAQPLEADVYAAAKKRQARIITQAQREAAADRVKAQVKTRKVAAGYSAAHTHEGTMSVEPQIGQGDVPDYFSPTVPNWNYTPKLRKFVDTLPGLGPESANNLQQYIPVAVPDKTAYPGLTPDSQSDYYEIAVVQYTQQMHSDLPPTTLRGYVQIDTPAIPDTPTRFALTYPDGRPIVDSHGNQVYSVDKPRYMGPMIISRKDVPVRIKFTNYLPTGAGGDLFVPVDPTVMGAGMGPKGMVAAQSGTVVNGATVLITTKAPHGLMAGDMVMLDQFIPPAYNGEYIVESAGLTETTFQVTLKADPGLPADPAANEDTKAGIVGKHMEMEDYTQNRAVVHLHGGLTPWISDGTPHQWITPAGENTSYPEGASVREVPDMPGSEAPDDGSTTLYYTNQQSARLMFYHDHVYGLTRLNVYVGEAAGYLIQDPVEEDLVARNLIPADQIPLIIQDKTFVDAETIGTLDPTWRWGTGADADGNGYPDYKTGDLWVPHVYMPAQNPADLSGMAAMGRWHYGPWFWPPVPELQHGPVPNPYFDSWAADPTNPDPARQVDGPATRPWEPEFIPGTPDPSVGMEHYNDTPLVNGVAYPTLTVDPKSYRLRILNAANDRFFNLSLFVADPAVSVPDPQRVSPLTEVKMVPAAANPSFPEEWPTDNRTGGVPDPTTAGPDWVQIGTEGGFLPAPAVIPARPVVWNWDQTTFNMGNVIDHSLLLGPAERADVIVDFSAYAGKTLILYNDAPVAFPALDPRQDYYTGMPDMRDTGSHWPTEPGFGPNVRTVMQIIVKETPVTDTWAGMAALETEWASSEERPGVFEQAQDPILVGQSAYDSAYTRKGLPAGRSENFPASGPYWGYSHIHDKSLRVETVDGTRLTIPMESKAIHDEMGGVYDQWGRMSGKMGTEVPGTNALTQAFSPLAYVDPSTEILKDNMTPLSPVLGDGTQIWKITHNGVDTHPIHFHLFNVQLINRVGWDGAIRLPDANELGWKETVRVSPLEDTIIAMRPIAPKLPFKIGDSVRLLDPTMPEGTTWQSWDPLTGDGPMIISNKLYNYGWEYMWHCHVLSHEEMEMMRPIDFTVSPAPASDMTATPSTTLPVFVTLNWVNHATIPTATNLLVERATDEAFTQNVTTINIAEPTAVTFTDTSVAEGTTFFYRVRPENQISYSAWSNSASATTIATLPEAPTNLVATVAGLTQIDLTWTDNANNELGFQIQRAVAANPVNAANRASAASGTYSVIATVPANQTHYSDTTVLPNVRYSYRVAAFSAAGDVASDDVIVEVATPPAQRTLGQVKATVADESSVEVANLVVTGVFPEMSAYYVEQLDRVAGIRVESPTLPVVGQTGSVQGTIETLNGERRITGAAFTPSGSTSVPKPLMMVTRDIGGGSNGLVPGMTGMNGLNNVGLLIRTSGKVVSQGDGYVMINDGSVALKVVALAGITLPIQGQMAIVTGECSVETTETGFHPILMVREQSDIRIVPNPAYSNVVTDWNSFAVAAIKTAGLTSVTASRALAMVHGAVYDSVNSITATHQPYRVNVPGVSGASREAAAATAAHRVLSGLFPSQTATLDALLASSLSTIPDGTAKTDGIAAGLFVADSMLAWRSNDHSTDMMMFMGGTNPGQWRPTPPGNGMGMMPQWGTVTPFAITDGAQFRLPAPPALTSPEYALAVNETKAMGKKNSPSRTAEQTQIAYFWADSPGTVTTVGRWNAIARDAAITRGYTLEESARLFAILNVSLADAGISSWDSKYYYALWRPITAIREAASDDNALTDAENTWEPELMTPAFPEYASAHSTFSAAGAEVLKRCFGTDNDVIAIPSFGNPVVYRSYGSFSQAADEAGISRIYGGIHFKFSDNAGKTAGRSIAGFVYNNYFRPAP